MADLALVRSIIAGGVTGGSTRVASDGHEASVFYDVTASGASPHVAGVDLHDPISWHVHLLNSGFRNLVFKWRVRCRGVAFESRLIFLRLSSTPIGILRRLHHTTLKDLLPQAEDEKSQSDS
jgi:hypothetical protein